MSRWILTIERPTPSQNVRDRQHHMIRHRIKKEWWWLLRAA